MTEPAQKPTLHGYLVIDKPGGWTSFDVVARARRILGEKRIGHAGTLDPAATGVLPLAVGAATKTLEFLTDASKTYLAEITFGIETDSQDIEGRVTRIADASALTADDVTAALAQMLGPQDQIPPMHSAIKIGGQKLYELARRGEEIARPPRPVTFYTLELCAWDPPVATILVDCSKGTYIRSLARDLGEALGTGAYLSNLVRTRSGPFTLDDAITIAEMEELPWPWAWPEIALHPDVPVQAWPALVLDDPAATRWQQGATIPAHVGSAGLAGPAGQAALHGVAGSIRAYDAAGRWLGTGNADETGTGWRPGKVVTVTAGEGSAA